MKEQLLFVYNANSNLFSTVTGFAHKILSPSTYQCQLCALTYGNVLIKQQWKSFIAALSIETVFLHKDEFEKQYKTVPALPAVFILNMGEIKEIITRTEIETCYTLEELKRLVTVKLKKHVQHYHSNLQ
ncbi:MAG: hypothetical protein M3R72_01625 [Bacteroidota bacterium]|nr:hypothetical protein [Bacteroidota bacterium]